MDKERQWRSADQKPINSIDVLVFDRRGLIRIGYLTNVGDWREVPGEFPIEVTHWMALPDHPGEPT